MKISAEELNESYVEYQTRVIKHFNMDPNYVIKLPLDEQTKYADSIVMKYITDENFINDIKKNFQGINTNTSACVIGNLSYIAKYYDYKPILEILEQCRK